MSSLHDRDEWLMAEAVAGRSDGLDVLVRRYAGPLLTFIRRMVGDEHRSEELFQETFLAVWAKRRQYTFPRPFKPWLYRIAVNKCHEAFRGRQQMPAGTLSDRDEEIPVPSGEASPERTAIATETSALVEAAVAKLPEKQRMVMVMRVWNGMSYAQIAETMGVREATVRSNMRDALAAVRRHLEPRMR